MCIRRGVSTRPLFSCGIYIAVIIFAIAFSLQYLQAFFQLKTDDRHIGRYAAACLHTMRQTKVSARKFPPSTIEIAVSSSYVLSMIALLPVHGISLLLFVITKIMYVDLN